MKVRSGRSPFTPDDRLLLSAGADGIVRIWDVEYGIPLGGD